MVVITFHVLLVVPEPSYVNSVAPSYTLISVPLLTYVLTAPLLAAGNICVSLLRVAAIALAPAAPAVPAVPL